MYSSTPTVFRFLPLVLIVLAGASVNPQNVARAADRGLGAPRSVKVFFSELNLTKPEGTAILYTRIRNAARTVCGPVDIALLEERAYWNQCVNETIANAVAKVGNTNFTAYHLAKTNRSHAIAAAQISKPVDAR